MRNLEQKIGAICRKQARRIAEGTRGLRRSDARNCVEEYLGAPRFRTDTEVAERTRRPGVAVGLAWTPVGGDVLFIEAGRMPGGSKGLIMTGQLGPVMQESVQAALTWVRANAADYGIDPDLFKTSDIHIHVPAGAIPKDGPSAGITMATALLSMLTERLRPPQPRHDRRDHPHRPGAARRRHQGKSAGGQARRRRAGHHAVSKTRSMSKRTSRASRSGTCASTTCA